ncbi:hypothetical protein [Streptomyces goshikiensis]|uniref:hypothetical protein n=1 Tax=Streptomyces goshikiensis TaxID=1942 RepID=UPI00365E9893
MDTPHPDWIGIAAYEMARPAAREAEASGYEDGAVRVLGVLLRVSADAGLQGRYDAAVARLTTRS